MATNNKFIHFKTRAGFNAELTRKGISNPSAAEGNDFYYYTVFIKDTKEIYTHGEFYNASNTITTEEWNGIVDNIETLPFVKYETQTLTEAQKAQARENIGACARRPIVRDWPREDFEPNIYYKLTVQGNINISLQTPSSDFLDEFFIEITTGQSSVLITWSDPNIQWADIPLNALDANCTYQISIIGNLATYLKFS